MKSPLLRAALCSACLTIRLAAAPPDTTDQDQAPIAEPPPAPAPASTPAQSSDDQKKLEEAIRLRLAEHALHKAAKAASATDTATPAGTPANPAAPAPAAAAQATPTKDEPATMLPRVEVSKSRVTELAIQLQEMDRQIAVEKKNIKPSALDDTLNDPTVSHKLAIFGGSSSEDRSQLAQERVSLLEAERDLIEEMATARTKEERDDLQNQLNELKSMRRELERTPKGTRGE